MLDPKPVPNFIPPIDIGKEPPDTDMETKVRYVYELVGDKQTFSHTKVLITLHEAASLILSYTNRTQLPKELDWMQVRIAADLLLYRTPDVDRDGGPNADSWTTSSAYAKTMWSLRLKTKMIPTFSRWTRITPMWSS